MDNWQIKELPEPKSEGGAASRQAIVEDDVETASPPGVADSPVSGASSKRASPRMSRKDTGRATFRNIDSAALSQGVFIPRNGFMGTMKRFGYSAIRRWKGFTETKIHAWASEAGDQVAERVSDAVQKLKDINIMELAKHGLAWVKANPRKTLCILACILVPLLFGVLTPVILASVGFGASGIVAGSLAAGIQAGIGNVVAGSAFAFLTSAGMGGFGLPILVGVVVGASAAITWAIAAWKFWRDGDDGGNEGGGFNGGDGGDEGHDRGGGGGGSHDGHGEMHLTAAKGGKLIKQA